MVQSYYPFQEKGGTVVKVRALAQALAARGHQVTILTADWGLGRLNGIDMDLERCAWGWRAAKNGVKTYYLSSIAHYRALTLNPQVIEFSRASLKDFDLVHFYGLYDFLGPAVSFFCRRQGLPYVIEPMGMYRLIDRGYLRKTLWHRALGRAFCGGASRFIATSEMEFQNLTEDGISRHKLVIRYNGVDPEIAERVPRHGSFRAKHRIPSEEPFMLFLGRLIPRKGADILIKAFADVCSRSGHLVIAGPEGEPGYRRHLEKCAERSGAAARVHFTGPLYDENKLDALADADIFVLPSRYENFANAPAEAIACNVPVIVSEDCGIGPLVDGCAGLVIPPREEALANALRQLIHNQALYARLKDGCRQVAQQLRWDRLSELMEAHYAEALTKRNESQRA